MTIADLKREAEADGWFMSSTHVDPELEFVWIPGGPCVHFDPFTNRVTAWDHNDEITEYAVSGIPAVMNILKRLLPMNQTDQRVEFEIPEGLNPVEELDELQSRVASGETAVVSPAVARRCEVDIRTLHADLLQRSKSGRVFLVKTPY